jgi:hypothetical protein
MLPNSCEEGAWQVVRMGAVQAGKSYMVGERGPEIIVPKKSGAFVSGKDPADKDWFDDGVRWVAIVCCSSYACCADLSPYQKMLFPAKQ